MSPISQAHTPAAPAARRPHLIEPAPLAARCMAGAIDLVAWTLLNGMLAGRAAALFSILPGGVGQTLQSVMAPVLSLALGWMYFALFESSGWHATPGKRLMNLTVTDINGVHLRLGRASLRYAGRLLSTAILGLGFLLVLRRPHGHALHDHIASTIVLRA